eukprot:5583618-Prymnesium_polylepis.1
MTRGRARDGPRTSGAPPPPFHNAPWGFEDGSVLKTIVRFETVDAQRHAVLKTPPFQHAPAVSERLRFRRQNACPCGVLETAVASKPSP